LTIIRQNVLQYLDKIIVAEITTQGKGYPTEIFINQKDNLPKPSFVQAENLHTVSKNRLIKFLGALDPETVLAVSQKVVSVLEPENAMPER
jgi:mRNA-degrading endonuclease toxin of MazEF toxin-antitoxin module